MIEEVWFEFFFDTEMLRQAMPRIGKNQSTFSKTIPMSNTVIAKSMLYVAPAQTINLFDLKIKRSFSSTA